MDNTWKYRAVRNIKDGIVKRYSAGTAAKLVACGECEYADDGPDESGSVEQRTKINRAPSPTIKVDSFGSLFKRDTPQPKLSPREERDMSKLTNTQRSALKAKATVPAPAVVTPSSINALKDAIERSKQRRKSQ